MFTYGPQVCGRLEAATALEWLVPDGLGGYAMGTAAGLRTRRYHGLLVVAGDPPARRMMALAALDPVLTLPGSTRVRLATHEWASGVVDPRGHELLSSFRLVDGLPCWRWRVGDAVLERRVAMVHGSPAVAVRHTLLAGGPVELTVAPLCTWRDAHGERHAGDDLSVTRTADGVVVADAYRVAGPGFEFDPSWYSGAYHRAEAERGLAPAEDLLRVGTFRARLEVGESLDVTAWAGDLATPPPPAAQIVAAAQARHAAITARHGVLGAAADAFVIRTASGPDVIAGYPWFGAWSRDTMTAYEGLFLCTDRADEGRELLLSYAATLSEGMLANTADTGSTEYNTADATLWFLHAVDRHVTRTGDTDLAAALVDPLDDVVRRHLTGCRYGIRVDDDGLVTQGSPGHALTWMDAVVHGVPVTPRAGKPVEINALWINGLAGLAALRARLGRDHTDLDALRARATDAFRRRFPTPAGWLLDTVDGPEGSDALLRPNQLLAYGLPYGPMRDSVSAATVRALGQALLTPLGPRSLAPASPGYRGRHRGGPAERDRAYHEGTVWPWLIGPYVDAARAAGLPTSGLLDGLMAHLGEAGIGSVSETADGDAPHAPTGCPFQAWSVAELLRAWQAAD